MQPFEIIKLIEKTAPLEIAADWDKSGIQVASGRENISHVAVMLDPTLDSISRALELKADFLLAHHPLSMKPRFPDTLDNYHAILSLLFKNDLCLYSAHTSLDAGPEGPARWLAKELALQGLKVLEPTGVMPQGCPGAGQEAGFGFVGDLAKPLPYGEFRQVLAGATGVKQWRVCGREPALVRRVACCPGSGADLADLAQEAGADLFITGDLKYHAALDAQLHIMDLGHFILEEIMMRVFAGALAAALPKLKFSFISAGDPFVFECAANQAGPR